MSLSSGVLNTAWMAVVSSTTPRPAPRWPPVFETALIVAWRTSSESCWICSSVRDFISAGVLMPSRRGSFWRIGRFCSVFMVFGSLMMGHY